MNEQEAMAFLAALQMLLGEYDASIEAVGPIEIGIGDTAIQWEGVISAETIKAIRGEG